MARKQKGKTRERFAGMPHRLMRADKYTNLSAYSKALLFELAFQYNGKNNGDLTLSESIIGKRGFAKSTVSREMKKLIEQGFIVVTRQGWKQRGKPTLLAITWYGIDDHPQGIDYDENIRVDPRPLGWWKDGQEPPNKGRKKPN